MRTDKFLWCVRLFKTRSAATLACTSGRALVNDVVVKPAKIIATGHVVWFKQSPIWRTYQVLDIPKSRVSAKLVSQYIREITSPADLQKLQIVIDTNNENKKLGIKGRPTKKDRRNLDKLF